MAIDQRMRILCGDGLLPGNVTTTVDGIVTMINSWGGPWGGQGQRERERLVKD